MPSCIGLLLECAASALAGIGIIGLCWRMWRPLELAQRYNKQITEQGMFGALPIYGYLRRYFFVLLLAACVVLLASVVTAALQIPDIQKDLGSCGVFGQAPVLAILILFLGIHMATILAFETTKRRHKGPYPIETLVEDVRKRLWGVAVFLMLAIGLVAIVATVVMSSK